VEGVLAGLGRKAVGASEDAKGGELDDMFHPRAGRSIYHVALQLSEPRREGRDQEETPYPGHGRSKGFRTLVISLDQVHFGSERLRRAPGVPDQRTERSVSGEQLPC
jgi:hypothetical protein